MQHTSALKHAPRHLALGLVLCMLLGALLLFRAQRAGAQAMAESDLAFDRGQLSLAVTKAADAMRWYFPFAQHVAAAEVRLLAVAEGAEASGELPLALNAWSALRGALHETAHGFSPPDPLLARCNQAIVRLLPHPGGLLAPTSDTAQLAEAYAETERNAPIFYVARSVGMALLLVGVWLLFLRQRQQGFALGVACLGCGLFAWVFAAIGA